MTIKETLRRQREFFLCGSTLDVDWRLKQLRALRKTIKKYEEKWKQSFQNSKAIGNRTHYTLALFK